MTLGQNMEPLETLSRFPNGPEGFYIEYAGHVGPDVVFNSREHDFVVVTC